MKPRRFYRAPVASGAERRPDCRLATPSPRASARRRPEGNEQRYSLPEEERRRLQEENRGNRRTPSQGVRFRQRARSVPRQGKQQVGSARGLPRDQVAAQSEDYWLSEGQLAELKKHVKDLRDRGLIVPSASPVAAPVFFVNKRDGSSRLVIDYRPLNKITLKSELTMPNLQDVLTGLGKAKWFSRLDLEAGYHQVQVALEDRWKTAFETRDGRYQFTVAPFGLSGVPATFQRLLRETFTEEVNDFVAVFLDDILIYSKTREEHSRHIRQVLKKLHQQELYIKPEKCEFAKNELSYLGYIIGESGVKPDPRNVEAVANWPERFISLKQVRAFLGKVGFYNKFIPNYHKLAHPLHEFLKEASPYTWSEVHTEAVNKLKLALVTAGPLQFFDPSKPITIKVDANRYALGAVLEQEGRPLAFESRKTLENEKATPVYGLELKAIVRALTQWKQMTLRTKISVETDNKTLVSLLKQEKVTPRLGAWIDKLSQFNIEIIYTPGAPKRW